MVAIRTILTWCAAVPAAMALRSKIPHNSGSSSKNCDSDEVKISSSQCCPGYELQQSSVTYCCVVDDDDDSDTKDGSNCLAKVDVTDSDYKKKVKDAEKDSGAGAAGVALGVVLGAAAVQLVMI